ncbi:uncharacterized protein IL334_002881 [Kwoniella shivajii]|uniref:HIT domain-containing protein n=1 Tax=Kwoniella shivajii TaxID=564305 RepID=A0ABZ1CXN7_9TREE|nr:hypothetical protein IL334_002881 [Kwoniella shivajii]
MPKFLSCLPTKRDLSDESLLAENGNTKVIKGCTFCDVSVEKGFGVIHEDDGLIAFHDRTPRATIHLLIIPRLHEVSSVRQLTKAHLPLVRSMINVAHSLVPESPPPKMGFHIPPFSSVPHLHLHVFSGEHTFIGKLKYPITGNRRQSEKGLGWFVTAEQVEHTLQNGRTVGLGRGSS